VALFSCLSVHLGVYLSAKFGTHLEHKKLLMLRACLIICQPTYLYVNLIVMSGPHIFTTKEMSVHLSFYLFICSSDRWSILSGTYLGHTFLHQKGYY